MEDRIVPSAVLYDRDFTPTTSATLAPGVTANWSFTNKVQSPSGEWFLGHLGNQTATLTLNNLPAHDSLNVEFDLYLLNTWDGNDPNWSGPNGDRWKFAIDGVTQVDSTFRNVRPLGPNDMNAGQSQDYGGSGASGSGPYASGTGATAINTLGYTWTNENGTQNLDSIYHFSVPIEHDATSVTITFTGSGLQGIGDESWGLDTVRVTASDSVVDLAADTNVDGFINIDDEFLEDDSLGKVLFVNDDDDNLDEVIDKDQAGPVLGEDDLVPVIVTVPTESDDYVGWQVRLSVLSGNGNITLWNRADKYIEIGTSYTYTIGIDEVPSIVWVEGLAVGEAILSIELLQPGFAEASAQDTIRFRIGQFDLDVNNNLTTNDAEDGFYNYMPGYVGTTPVLSTGMYSAVTPLTPQPLHAMFNGLGASVGISRVAASLTSVSAHEGYAENMPDPGDGTLGDMDDVSFSSSENKTLTDTNDDGAVINDKSWINFFVRDYAATSNFNAWIYDSNGQLRANHTRQVVRDRDGDGLQDKWEVNAVAEYTAQTGITFTVAPLTVFSGGSDNPTNELADPDGANADGGRDLVAHKSAGDSLSVFQEYRGFVLDGGGFDDAGQNGHAGGHKRLSPAFKELLVEVDAMPKASVANMPTAAELRTVMEGVSKGYSDRNNGAGIRVYWVVDEPSATYQPLASGASEWARDHRNTEQLSEFLHLMFTGDAFGADALGYTYEHDTTGVVANGRGCFVFPNSVSNYAAGAAFLDALAAVAAHEIGHALIEATGAPGFDDGEHMTDPDPADAPGGLLDEQYLMFFRTMNLQTIVFADILRSQIDLSRKESVEL